MMAGIGSASPSAAAGLLSAHVARSIPDSAMARAWATDCWLLAINGSVVARMEKATTSVMRMTVANIAMGSAMPRSSMNGLKAQWERMDISLTCSGA
jgi:hypothetical protein